MLEWIDDKKLAMLLCSVIVLVGFGIGIFVAVPDQAYSLAQQVITGMLGAALGVTLRRRSTATNGSVAPAPESPIPPPEVDAGNKPEKPNT